jgi:hypothetical protein
MTPSKAPLPFLGTWKLSKCETSRPDLPHLTSGITTFTQKEDGIHYTSESVWSDGRSTKTSYISQMDGDWCPVSGSTMTDSLSLRRQEDGSLDSRMKKGGVDVGTVRATVSADGRIMTGHWGFVGPGGATVTWKTTAERQ